MKPEPFLTIARRPAIIKRGLIYAVIVGPILITINHYDAIIGLELSTPRLLKMALTMLVPYLVSTFSSVAAIRNMQRQLAEPNP